MDCVYVNGYRGIGDSVTEIPVDAIAHAFSSRSKNEIFTIRNNILSMQFLLGDNALENQDLHANFPE